MNFITISSPFASQFYFHLSYYLELNHLSSSVIIFKQTLKETILFAFHPYKMPNFTYLCSKKLRNRSSNYLQCFLKNTQQISSTAKKIYENIDFTVSNFFLCSGSTPDLRQFLFKYMSLKLSKYSWSVCFVHCTKALGIYLTYSLPS